MLEGGDLGEVFKSWGELSLEWIHAAKKGQVEVSLYSSFLPYSREGRVQHAILETVKPDHNLSWMLLIT